MTDKPGPWSQIPPPETSKPRLQRRVVPMGPWLALVAAICLGVWGLARLFPGRLQGDEAAFGVVSGVTMAAYMGARLLSGHISGQRTPRHLLVWALIVVLLVVGYSFRDDMAGLAMRVRSELIPSYPVAAPGGAVVISRDQDGGFYVTGKVNGRPVRFLVDTGASDVVLSPADARRLGIDVDTLTFGHPVETANGQGFGAPITVDTLQVGSISLTQAPVSVNKAAMSSSLLGMAFFNRLKSFRFEGDRLVLQPKT